MWHIKRLVNYKGVSYYVSTAKLFYSSYIETMIFMCKRYVETIEELCDDDICWSDLYVERYSSFEDAKRRHNEICNNIGKYVERK